MPAASHLQPPVKPGGPFTQSLFVSDAVINPHPRFGALTQNIRTRRGEKVDIRMPRFRDTETPKGVVGAPPPTSLAEAEKMDEVYMDAMAFGMGCCCLQVTPHPRTHGQRTTRTAGGPHTPAAAAAAAAATAGEICCCGGGRRERC